MRAIRGCREDTRMTRGRRSLLALAGVAVLVAGLSALATAEVVARGKLVPSGGPGVRRVRVWDSFEFYISSETARPPFDVLTTIAFSMLAATMGIAALMLVVSNARGRLLACLAIVAVAATYLATDELLAIHESIGHNLQFLRSIPGVERPDDLVLASYAVPIGLFAWYFRDILLSVRPSVWLLGVAAASGALASISDLIEVGEWEERAELITATLVLAGFVVLATALVPRALVSADRSSVAPTPE